MCRGSHTRKRPPERKTRSGVLFLVVVVVAMDAGLVGSGGVGNGGRGRDMLGRDGPTRRVEMAAAELSCPSPSPIINRADRHIITVRPRNELHKPYYGGGAQSGSSQQLLHGSSRTGTSSTGPRLPRGRLFSAA